MDWNVWYDAWVWMFATYLLVWFPQNESPWWDNKLGSLWLGCLVEALLLFPPSLSLWPHSSIGFWISWWVPMIIILWMNERKDTKGDGYDVLFRLRLFLLCVSVLKRRKVSCLKNLEECTLRFSFITYSHTQNTANHTVHAAIALSSLSALNIFSISLFSCPFSNCTSSPTSFCEFPSLHQSNNNNFLFPFLI